MVLSISTADILGRLSKVLEKGIDDGWVLEPPASRLALMAREVLERWTETAYPGSSCQAGAVENDSRRGLSLTIHAAPTTHRVEIWGLACGDEREKKVSFTSHAPHSWVILAHQGPGCAAFKKHAEALEAFGLKRVDHREGKVTLSLWRGSTAPDGCPDCSGGAPAR